MVRTERKDKPKENPGGLREGSSWVYDESNKLLKPSKFPVEIYHDESSEVMETLLNGTSENIINQSSGWKIDAVITNGFSLVVVYINQDRIANIDADSMAQYRVPDELKYFVKSAPNSTINTGGNLTAELPTEPFSEYLRGTNLAAHSVYAGLNCFEDSQDPEKSKYQTGVGFIYLTFSDVSREIEVFTPTYNEAKADFRKAQENMKRLNSLKVENPTPLFIPPQK
ncbi:MAG: hypothetical protein AAB521_04185 [Patescibacteria group bacterium]